MICLTFKNNSGLLKSGTAILLLNGITELTMSTSSLKFSYNKATLSGGITFQNTRMFVYSFVKAEFKNNEGGNGGAMAFYQKSVIYAFTKERSRRVNVSFYNNKALKRGGAIFVKDSDYMNVVTNEKNQHLLYTSPRGRNIVQLTISINFQITVLR